MRLRRGLVGLLVIVALAAASVIGRDLVRLLLPPTRIAGEAIVADGDSLVVRGERVRLLGIDAPELAQECARADGGSFACGRAAQQHLRELTRRRGAVACEGRERDRYDRLLAICRAGADDLAAAMVRDGWAVSADDYALEERQARAAKRGLWAGRFEPPADFRRRNPRADATGLVGDGDE